MLYYFKEIIFANEMKNKIYSFHMPNSTIIIIMQHALINNYHESLEES